MIRDAIAPMGHQCNAFGKSNDSIKEGHMQEIFQGVSSLYAL